MGVHLIEPARTGRSRCRSCGQAIIAGELRLGVGQPQENGGHSHQWLHLTCAATDRFLELEEALAETALPIPDRARLDAEIAAQIAQMPAIRRPYAVTGGSLDAYHCASCGGWSFPSALRVLVSRTIVVGGRTLQRDVPLDPECAKTTLGDPNLLQTLLANSALDPAGAQWLTESLT